MGKLPIRLIDFTTPPDQREKAVAELVAAYDMGNPVQNLNRVGEVLGSNQTDIVHDLLAGVMIDLNQQKQAETERFLAWLEGQIGGKVDDLSGKTYVQGYLGDYQKGQPEYAPDDLIDRLTGYGNPRKMQANIKDAALQGRIRDEYEASLPALHPVKARLRETDALIDRIVYALYGLTEEEIAVVEGGYNREKTGA